MPILKPPQIVLLAEMPQPLTIEVPAKAGGSYTKKINNKEIKIDLLPPDTKPAGFLSIMQNYTTTDGLALDEIYCGIFDKMGNLWLGTDGAGVSKFNGKSFINYTTAQGLPNNEVRSILEDKTGHLWFSTSPQLNGGVCKYNGKTFTIYTMAQGLAYNFIRCSLEDKMGNLWFGAYEVGGVSKYDGKSFTTYTTAQGLPIHLK